MNLQQLVSQYKQTQDLWNTYPDRFHSNPSFISDEFRKVSDKYFALRDELRKRCLQLHNRNDPHHDDKELRRAAAAYGVWAQAAEETARINLLGCTSESVIIMEHLARTEDALLALVSSPTAEEA
tara:strand:- start:278 stop:652 length:375 start_codon:yes stop_codon:yes gene_type:complete